MNSESEEQRSLVLYGKTPQNTWEFIPPTNRLLSLYGNEALALEMRHRVDRKVNDNVLQDVFDGQHYRDLTEREVEWRGDVVEPPKMYFANETDVALGFGTDGIAPLQKGLDDFWPLLLTVYNLPPEIRYQKEFQICCGIMPGTPRMEYSIPVVLISLSFQERQLRRLRPPLIINPTFSR